jgi:hypothetical protein
MRLSSWLRSARSFFVPPGTEKGHRPTRLRKPSTAARLGVERLEDRTVPSTFTVLNLADGGDGSLRAAILGAETSPGADVIQFARQVRGTITLTTGELDIRSDLTIEGPGANRITVSGNDTSRVFDVVGGGDASGEITVAIAGLEVSHGRANVGGGILNSGFSDLTLTRVVLSENVAVGGPTAALNARGGAVHSVGSGSAVSVIDSLVIGNIADGRPNATRGSGGGLSVEGGRLSVIDSMVADNLVFGGSPTISGAGGGISVFSGATGTVAGSTIRDNRSVGAAGGGPAHGGGILVTQSSSLVVSHSLLTRNEAHGGNGNLGRGRTEGGAIDVEFGSRASITDSVLTDNRAVAGSGSFNNAAGFSAATASGGAISVGVVSPGGNFLEVTRSVLRGNEAIGGNNATSTAPTIADVGSAHGGAIFTARGSVAVIRDSAILRNKAVGGDGNTGSAPVGFIGTATGGGIDNSIAVLATGGPSQPAKLTVIDSIFVGNEAVGGDGNTGGGEHVFLGAGLGGGIANYLGGTTDITGSLLALNRAAGGEGGLGAGGGIFNGVPDPFGVPSLTLHRSLVVLNRADGGAAGAGVSAGLGLGGGLYLAPGGVATADPWTVILANDASTSDDDVFGFLI